MSEDRPVDDDARPSELGLARVVFGLLVAGLIAWLLWAAKDFTPTLVSNGLAWSPADRSFFAFYAVFGIPAALAISLFVGFPAWAMTIYGRDRRKAVDVAMVGAAVGAIIALPIALYSLAVLTGPTIQLREAGVTFVEDGKMTVHAWTRVGTDALFMVGVGVVSALAAWTASGAARRKV